MIKKGVVRMLTITVPEFEYFNEMNNTFVKFKSETFDLEHSLISLSKWESKWKKPFLSKEKKTEEEAIDYIKCMTITRNIPNEVYSNLSPYDIEQILKYIDEPMTATTFSEEQMRHFNRAVITNEIIYYWMIINQIPFECQKWHLNRLLTLIKVCSIKNAPPKKIGRKSVMQQNARLNAERRKHMGTKG